jgi:capsular polysaccharide export protein
MFGFSIWKRNNIKSFLKPLNQNEIHFCNSINQALKKGLDTNSKLFIWGKKDFDDVVAYTKEYNIPLCRIEDGFIRSVTLGSDLSKAYSLVVDSRGIYFDPTSWSDLEYILLNHTFDDALLYRANQIKEYILKSKLSKYNIHANKDITLTQKQPSQKVILVPGQVEDDASIIYGASSMSNLELLKQTRANKPNEYIIYKPHPDVLSGNRKGHIDTTLAYKYCDIIILDASLDSILSICDEVHTMTSLVGFEALLRGKDVYTYGKPFYAGWGLTHDHYQIPRRNQPKSLLELIAATYILYPRYINPHSNKLCEIEVVIDKINKEKNRYNYNKFYRYSINIRNLISRKIQLIIKWIVNILETL